MLTTACRQDSTELSFWSIWLKIRGFQQGGGRVFQKTAFLRHFLKFNLDFKKKFSRYDQKIYRGVEEFLGEHFPIYRMLVDLFNMSAEGGLLSWGLKNVIKNTYFQVTLKIFRLKSLHHFLIPAFIVNHFEINE